MFGLSVWPKSLTLTHTGTLDQSVKVNSDNDQGWNYCQQLQGKCDVVWENSLRHLIWARMVMATTTAEITISKGWHGLRKLTGAPDQRAKGNTDDQGWNKHQRRQGKCDMVRENLLEHLIRVRRVTMMTKAEITISNYKERVMWPERTHWGTWSECKRWWQWPQLKWTPATTRKVWCGQRKLTGTFEQSAKGDNDDQGWNYHQQLQGKGGMVWENSLRHLVQAWTVMATTTTEITVSKGWHGLRKLTGAPDQRAKGNTNDQGWNKHQQWQVKGDMVWENLLGHLIRVWRVKMTTKAEITVSNYKERVTWSEKTHWDTRSEGKGWRWWPSLKWTWAMTRKGWCGLKELTGILDQSAKGDNDNQGWNHHHQLQGKHDVFWSGTPDQGAKGDDDDQGWNCKKMVIWYERAYWDTWSVGKGQWWWSRLKWTPAPTRKVWC